MAKVLWLSLILCVLSAAGCHRIAGPDWGHPGSASDQLRRAKRYDPFPESENIGPMTNSVRPRGFETPIAEPSQARWQLNHWEP